MSRPNEKTTARWRARQFRRDDAHRSTPKREAEFVTAMQAEIWHRRYPPASVMQALGTACGHPVPGPDMRVFAGLDIMLRVRGWKFIGECSGPEVLTFSYAPSDAGQDYMDSGLEPVTTIVATLDRSLSNDTVEDCEVEVLLVGAPHGEGRLTGLAALTPHLRVIEAHRPGDPIPVPFPIGRARTVQRGKWAGTGRLAGSAV
ncbi:hypothetical protein [Nocardia sp. NPDC051463]|uniref:hypothetical protein n=1 Tax=Nocardia sp. NPDC051463 TaxID=3154845 RepID=UPI0034509E82